MIELDGGVNQHPENGNVFQIDPAVLMRDNPAALIVNREAYARMAGKFTYGPNGQFEPPQVVRVTTFSAAHKEAVKLFVLDGLTRTKFVDDNKDKPAVIAADFKFRVRDVTASVLQNPSYIPEGERQDGQQALTMLQYLRAVIPPTIAHRQIAADRIAAHIINAWENRVGPELANKFSALAALSFLANGEVPTATDKLLDDFLKRQHELIAGETSPEQIHERVNLQLALREFAEIIRQTKLHKAEVARSAYMLVGTASAVIGGEKEALKQVHGRLYSRGVEAKLADAFPDLMQREQIRIQLGKDIWEALARSTLSPNRERFYNDIGKALEDPRISFVQLNEVLRAADPSRIYDQARQSNNRDRLQRYYQTLVKTNELSETATLFLDRFGRVTELHDADFSRISNQIRSIEDALKQAEACKEQLNSARDDMARRGVTSDTIDTANSAIDTARQQLLEVTSLHNIQRSIQKLEAVQTETRRRIARQTALYAAGRLADEVYGASLRSPAGSRLRKDLAFYICREVDVADQSAVRARLFQLKSLDDDLQTKVLEDEIRINKAMQMQRERRQPPAEPAKVRDRSRDTISTPPAAVAAQPEASTVSAEVQDIENQMAETRGQADRMRIEINNHRLRQGAQAFLNALRYIDLDTTEIRIETKTEVDEVLNILGKIRFHHPDIVRVMAEDYPRLQEEILRLRQLQIEEQIEEAARDTRTGR